MIEILVVIGIIAVLAAILIPVLGSARASSQSVACLANLRGIMMGFHLYAGDNGEKLPDPAAVQQSWESLLKNYVSNRESYHCPSDGVLFENLRSSYDWRDTPDADTTLAGKSFGEIIRPGVVFVFDALPDWHRKDKINVGLSDGSTKTMLHQHCLEDLDKSIYDP
jgi:type II secretory pathway pseudopilin PulG